MTKKIIQKVCGFAVSAAMAFGSIASPVAEVWAEESAALAGAGGGCLRRGDGLACCVYAP